MNNEILFAVKTTLFEKCQELVNQKTTNIKLALREAQDAANNETKSSAGDKHETGRAMAQLETEKLVTQLSATTQLSNSLERIDITKKHQTAQKGSLITTNYGVFFIAISLGKILLNEETYFVISAVSPVGKKLIGLNQNNSFQFNDRTYLIKNIV